MVKVLSGRIEFTTDNKVINIIKKQILATLLLSATVISFAEDTAPESTVEIFHARLLDIMKESANLGYQGRFEELSPIIPDVFNTPIISQVILGRYWKDLTEIQKSEFITLYEKLVTATYADRFDRFNNEAFNTRTTEELNRGRVLVKTEFRKSNNEIINLDYLMSKTDNKWRIISVIANGANDISIKRGEYSDVIKNNGYAALLMEIQKKIDEAEK